MNFDFDLNNEIDPVELLNLIEQKKPLVCGDGYYWADHIEIMAGDNKGRLDTDPWQVDVAEDGTHADELIRAARRYAEANPTATEIWLSGELRRRFMYDGCDEPEEEPGHEWWSIDLKV